MTIERLWKVNAVITMFLAVLTGIQFASEMYVLALFAAFSTGFALCSTCATVLLDIHEIAAVPPRQY